VSRTLAHAGIQDPDIIPILHGLKRSTFFTHDQDFWKYSLAHKRYCLVWLDVYDGDAAFWIRRFLRHSRFLTQAQRMGTVVRVHSHTLRYWESGKHGQALVNWQST
jgi:hypothetical protein